MGTGDWGRLGTYPERSRTPPGKQTTRSVPQESEPKYWGLGTGHKSRRSAGERPLVSTPLVRRELKFPSHS
ncbi:hypothetical protein [Nostoc sp.]|uniref:hypothetical protein n=1 Tax=Nostoc sp. TaxID=1180 RepID=UPI002FFA3ECB